MVVMLEPHAGVFVGGPFGEGRVGAWKKGFLEFASHADLLLHLVLDALDLLGVIGCPQFGLLVFGDVARNPEGADDLAVRIPERHLGGRDPGNAAVRPGFLFLDADERLAAGHNALLIVERLLGMGRGKQVEVGFADHIVRFQPRPVAKPPVDHDEAGIAVLEVDVVRHVLQEVPQQKPPIMQLVGHANLP